jgi:hypothetical protein
MASQNLISASIAAETKADILKQLSDIRTKLDFLLTLQPEDVQSLFKVGNGFAPFVDKAYTVAAGHPQILPGVFDVEEFKKDYTLAKDIMAITDEVNELSNGLQNTLTAANSDALVGALEVYAAVKQHRDKVPGLNVVANEMAVFFKKSPRTAGKASATVS